MTAMPREHLLTFCDPLIFGNATIFKYTNRKRPEFSYRPASPHLSLLDVGFQYQRLDFHHLSRSCLGHDTKMFFFFLNLINKSNADVRTALSKIKLTEDD